MKIQRQSNGSVWRFRGSRGSAAIELALSSALLFATAFGVIDYGRMFSISNAVAGAARAGTQYGGLDVAKNTDYAGMQSAALAVAPVGSGMTSTATQFCTCGGTTPVACNATCGFGARRTYVKVMVNRPYTTLWTWASMNRTRNVSATSIVRVQ